MNWGGKGLEKLTLYRLSHWGSSYLYMQKFERLLWSLCSWMGNGTIHSLHPFFIRFLNFHLPNLENSAVATGLERVVFIPIPKKGNAKECSNYYTIALISQASKVMLKILQVWLQQYMNHEIPDVQAGFRKGRGTRDQIANICWITEKAREFKEKHLLLLYWLYQSLWLWGPQQTVENSEKDGNTRPPDLPPEKSVYRSGSNS